MSALRSPSYQHDYVYTTLHQQVQPVLVVVVSADCCAAQQLLARVFGGQREISVLLEVCAGNDGHQVALFVHYGEFSCRRGEDRAHIKHRGEVEIF